MVSRRVDAVEKKRFGKSKKKISTGFLSVLSIVSILGFFGIVMKTLFEMDITIYIEVLWILVLGFGLLIESNLRGLFRIKETGLTSESFRELVTAVVGFLAVLTGVLLLPQIGWVTPALLAVQGIISLVAMIFILIQSLILKE